MARTTEQIGSEVRKILLERIIHEAMRGKQFGLAPVDLLREAAELVEPDAMLIVNAMPSEVEHAG